MYVITMFQSNCDINYSLRKLIIFIQNNTHTYRKKMRGVVKIGNIIV